MNQLMMLIDWLLDLLLNRLDRPRRRLWQAAHEHINKSASERRQQSALFDLWYDLTQDTHPDHQFPLWNWARRKLHFTFRHK